MSWRIAVLRNLGAKSLLTGVVAGLWAGVLAEGATLLAGESGIPLLGYFLSGAGLGFAMGVILAPAEHWFHGFPSRARWAVITGALSGMITGALGFGGAGALFENGLLELRALPVSADTLYWILIAIVMTVLGGVLGWAAGFHPGGHAMARQRFGQGLIFGAFAAIPFAVLMAAAGGNPWVALAGTAGWGGIVAMGLLWLNKRRARRWLRVLTGAAHDPIFALSGGNISLGKLESNDIPLLGFEEVYPFHCQLIWEQDHYEIRDHDQGGTVLVNFRPAQTQALKSGDLIKIGTALIQYGEAS